MNYLLYILFSAWNIIVMLVYAIDKIKGYGKITEDNISEIIREVRLAILE